MWRVVFNIGSKVYYLDIDATDKETAICKASNWLAYHYITSAEGFLAYEREPELRVVTFSDNTTIERIIIE